MNVERWETAIRLLQDWEDNGHAELSFDFRTWGDWKKEDSPVCGSICCGLGYLGRQPEFIKQGFIADVYQDDGTTLICYKHYSGENAAEKFFGIPKKTAFDVFSVFEYDPNKVYKCGKSKEKHPTLPELIEQMKAIMKEELSEPEKEEKPSEEF
jgi:hypothetical protein